MPQEIYKKLKILKNKKERKMRNEYISRREAYSSWSRNQNTVRHASRPLGTVSTVGIFIVMVAIMGLIFIGQTSKATAYDYELSDVESEIAELKAQKEDLAVEKARLTSIAAAEKSEVAANMPDAEVSGYASN